MKALKHPPLYLVSVLSLGTLLNCFGGVTSFQRSSARAIKKGDRIGLSLFVRNYEAGPLENHFGITTRDVISAYVGPPHPDTPELVEGKQSGGGAVIRAWIMLGYTDTDEVVLCEPCHFLNYGMYARFVCPTPGRYRAYAYDKSISDCSSDAPPNHCQLQPPKINGPGGDPLEVWQTIEERRVFDLNNEQLHKSFYANMATVGHSTLAEKLRHIYTHLKQDSKIIAVSDPIYVEGSTYCYYWMYRIVEFARSGYVEQEVSSNVGVDEESYIVLDLYIWIAEHAAVITDEAMGDIGHLVVSDYSKLLTYHYFNMGVHPCLRKAHLAIEITHDITYVSEFDQENKLNAPYWKAQFQIHMDRLITTLSDVSFTISSSQQTALFNCFVGETRVFVDIKLFDFVERKKLERGTINLEMSKIGNEEQISIEIQLHQIYGLGVQYIGNEESRQYEPGTSRTDLVVFHNPCLVQEFAIAVGGTMYIAEKLLQEETTDLKKVHLPSFGSEINSDEEGKEEATVDSPNDDYAVRRNFLRIHDVTFTPTHFVVLMSDSSVFLHPTSVTQKGIGRLGTTIKYQLDTFSKRRWCGKTSTPKLSNMLVPAFSTEGSIIIIQLYPIEGSTRMWINPPSDACLQGGVKYVAKSSSLQAHINETDIHFNDYVAVSRSDGRGIRIPTPPPRPDPPPPKQLEDLEEELAFLLNNGNLLEEGADPHFPVELANPASQEIGSNMTDYNTAVIYVIDSKESSGKVKRTLNDHGLNLDFETNNANNTNNANSTNNANNTNNANSTNNANNTNNTNNANSTNNANNTNNANSTNNANNTNNTNNANNTDNTNGSSAGSDNHIFELQAVEFTAVEKQFLAAIRFNSKEISDGQHFQLFISTITVTNLPFIVKPPVEISDVDEILDVIVPFPGGFIIRSKAHTVKRVRSRDPIEEAKNSENLGDGADVDYHTRLFPIGTAIPSYIVDLGNVLMFTSLEGRYARPLYYFEWTTIDKTLNPEAQSRKNELLFDDSTPMFEKSTTVSGTARLYDVAVTEQGIISVLWRKDERYLIKDADCIHTPDSPEPQSIAIGSVIINDGLREVRPFFGNDNVFQMETPDGEIIYGKYDTKPYSPIFSCPTAAEGQPQARMITGAMDSEMCIEQTKEEGLPVCAGDKLAPCLDAAVLPHCTGGGNNSGSPPCLRPNKLGEDTRCHEEQVDFKDPVLEKSECYSGKDTSPTKCWPGHVPREELRSIQMLSTSFYSYLHGSLKSVTSIHPEAPLTKPDEPPEVDPGVCPFASFSVHNMNFDFAEVGYQTRITGQISYLGVGIPVEADLIVETELGFGIVVEQSTSVLEQRGLTTIRKVVDIRFVMTDFQLEEMHTTTFDTSRSDSKKNVDFSEIRAREKSKVFSITMRPSIVNLHCSSSDYFKTIQFNVGCNTFSSIKLISPASPFHRYGLAEDENFVWLKEGKHLNIPKVHIYRHQIGHNQINCSAETERCLIPYLDLFGDEIFSSSYRDLFFPKFEQFLTVTARLVTGNVVIYDLLGSSDFSKSLNLLSAGCSNTGGIWFESLLKTTKDLNGQFSVHEDVYKYFQDCFDDHSVKKNAELADVLGMKSYHLHNLTNKNSFRFQRNRNQIFVFRAVVVNTYDNRFTYCRTLETFFLVRITGIPIPRQGLPFWAYLLIMLLVVLFLIGSYVVFHYFYSWKVGLPPGRRG